MHDTQPVIPAEQARFLAVLTGRHDPGSAKSHFCDPARHPPIQVPGPPAIALDERYNFENS
jgi:hypothetical protein